MDSEKQEHLFQATVWLDESISITQITVCVHFGLIQSIPRLGNAGNSVTSGC